ncbi:MAG: hypothetical protein H0V92_10130 [Pseudonocardiales bacterium]|nr:hypothetical protein [Pseudonocardiales bacterium]
MDYYARGFATTPGSSHLTLPFGMDNQHFEPQVSAIPTTDDTPRFVMLNKPDDHQATWSTNHTIQVAVGAEASPDTPTGAVVVARMLTGAHLQTKPSPRIPIWDPGLVGTVTCLSAR